MPRGRSAGYDDQRTLILRRAAHLFARRGYPATSMNEVAHSCGLSKAALYHYFPDKQALLFGIADGHVSRLAALVDDAPADEGGNASPEARLRDLIGRILAEYADAQDAQRVLTEDVKFLADADRERVLDQERRVVARFADLVAGLRPELRAQALDKPLTLLLFGMVNWLFTWMKPGGALDHATLAPIVADLFLGGVPAVRAAPPRRRPQQPSREPLETPS